MGDCECLEGCPFFNDKMANMPAMSATYKKSYCKSNFADCARYKIFKTLGKGSVPVDLFPNQIDRAEEILKNSKKQ